MVALTSRSHLAVTSQPSGIPVVLPHSSKWTRSPLPLGAAVDSVDGFIGQKEVVCLTEAARKAFDERVGGAGRLVAAPSLADRASQIKAVLTTACSWDICPVAHQAVRTIELELRGDYSPWKSDLALSWNLRKIAHLQLSLFEAEATPDSRTSILRLLEKAFEEFRGSGVEFSLEQFAKLEEVRRDVMGKVGVLKTDGLLPADAAINIPVFFHNLEVREFYRNSVLPHLQLLRLGAAATVDVDAILANTASLPAPLRASIVAKGEAIPPGTVDRAAKVLGAIDSALKELPQYTPGPDHVVAWAVKEKARLDAEKDRLYQSAFLLFSGDEGPSMLSAFEY